MAAFILIARGYINVSHLGEIADVTLSAIRSVASLPACDYTHIPWTGLPSAPPGNPQQGDCQYATSGNYLRVPACGPSAPRSQPLPSPLQHHHYHHHRTCAVHTPPLIITPAAPASTPGPQPAAADTSRHRTLGVLRRGGWADWPASKFSGAEAEGPLFRTATSPAWRRPSSSALPRSLASSAGLGPTTRETAPPPPPQQRQQRPQQQQPQQQQPLLWPGGTLVGSAPQRYGVSSSAQPRKLSYRSYQTITPTLRADIQAAALKKQTGVSLKYLLDFGTQPLERQMLLSARFLHSEIPIRLAHRLMDLNQLPTKLSQEPHVRRVKGWYADSFADFRSFPAIKDNMDVVRFTAMLKSAVRRHNNVVPAIAKGVEEYKRDLERTGESSGELDCEIQHFLDTFFLSRIAIRFLAGHHISMFEHLPPDHIGLVHTRCSPYMIASDAVSAARAMCFREYGGAPQVTVLGNTGLTMAYVPSHLHHMVFELVKNSLRAVQERYSESEGEAPPIQVVVAEGLEDVTIKVSDQGGGIPRSGLQLIWTYLYTTARSPLPDVDIDSANMPTVLAGYGCGLPLSRLYARYFGGDLQIISMEGYGTDAYLHLARLGNDEEPLPGAV